MSNDNLLLTDKQKRSALLFACLVGFAVVDSLPRTALGKVQKHLLPKP